MEEPIKLKFRMVSGAYAIVRLEADAAVPRWATKGEFNSITQTGDELSIVCPSENVPEDVTAPLRWICLKLQGPFPFSQTGVLLSFIEPLSGNNIPIFAISTYDTDYVFIQEGFVDSALEKLKQNGHERIA